MEYATRSIGAFLTDIADATVAPAGGTAGAVVGAIGTACCEMVCIHLQAAEVDAAVDLAELKADLEGARAQLLELGDADAAVVEALFGPDGDADPTIRTRAVAVPLATSETCLDALETAAVLTGTADRPVVADAATGSYFIEAALRSAVATARTNLDAVDDESFSGETARRLRDVEAAADRAMATVQANIEPAA